jgi:membrane protein implicated in regulation of membrane protease activity
VLKYNVPDSARKIEKRGMDMDVVLFGFTMNVAIVWVIAAVIFALIEAATTSLTTLWFVIGALVAAVAALLGAGIAVQVILFFAVSILLLILTRPLLKKRMQVGKEKTNVDALVGKRAKVTKEIGRLEAGEVRVNGLTWVAIPRDPDRTYTVGSEVTITRVEGVKLIVE